MQEVSYEEIKRANEMINMTNIKGKEYAEVNQRIKAFRMIYPTGKIETALVSCENGICVFKAIVATSEGNILGTGTAYEKENSSFINKTSYIENCETSAVGRALGMAGFGIDTCIASAEEVRKSVANENREIDENVKNEFEVTSNRKINKTKQDALKMSIENNQIRDEKVKKILEQYGFENISDITLKEYANVIEAFQKIIDK